MTTVSSFQDLKIWQESRELRQEVSKIAKSFPAKEQYSLTSQIIRSSRSVAANIAEGYGRFHFRETMQYARQARGSLYETHEHLLCAFDEGYLDKQSLSELEDLINNCVRLLNGYINYLKAQLTNI